MEVFSNNPLDVDTLPDYEMVPLNAMHKDYLKVMYFSVGIFMMVLALVLIVFYVFNSFISNNILVFSGLYFALLGLNIWLTRLRFKKLAYALREKDIIYQRGVLATHTTIVPFNRIQHVAINEPVMLRLFDLASLQIYTAGGSSSDLQ
jgi:membrane protein YdbS with pleckstrin-like domain